MDWGLAKVLQKDEGGRMKDEKDQDATILYSSFILFGHWSIYGGHGGNCTAVWSKSKPVSLAAGTTLTFEMQFGAWNDIGENLARFRLSVRGDSGAFARFAAMQRPTSSIYGRGSFFWGNLCRRSFSMNTGQRGSDSKLMSSMWLRPTGNHARKNSRSTNAWPSADKNRGNRPESSRARCSSASAAHPRRIRGMVECRRPGQSRPVFALDQSMSAAQSPVKPDVAVLHDVDWATYTRLLRAFERRRRFRLTYDRGTLEIRSPLWEHEKAAYILGAFVDCIIQEFQLSYEPGRTVTLRRRRQSRGLEPDNCYWIASAGKLAGKTNLDLRVDPPPDLAIEVDVTHGSLDRMGIYAALGVPEVWRVTSDGLTFNILESGVYRVRPQSLSFPQLASADLLAFLAQLGQTGTGALIVKFRDWVRQVMPHRP